MASRKPGSRASTCLDSSCWFQFQEPVVERASGIFRLRSSWRTSLPLNLLSVATDGLLLAAIGSCLSLNPIVVSRVGDCSVWLTGSSAHGPLSRPDACFLAWQQEDMLLFRILKLESQGFGDNKQQKLFNLCYTVWLTVRIVGLDGWSSQPFSKGVGLFSFSF